MAVRRQTVLRWHKCLEHLNADGVTGVAFPPHGALQRVHDLMRDVACLTNGRLVMADHQADCVGDLMAVDRPGSGRLSNALHEGHGQPGRHDEHHLIAAPEQCFEAEVGRFGSPGGVVRCQGEPWPLDWIVPAIPVPCQDLFQQASTELLDLTGEFSEIHRLPKRSKAIAISIDHRDRRA